MPESDPFLMLWREAAWCHLLLTAGRHRALVAGLVDGEGTVTVNYRWKSQRCQPVLYISNTSDELAAWCEGMGFRLTRGSTAPGRRTGG